MSSPKANCLRCGSEFLQATANVTGGYCMKCCSKGSDGKYVPYPKLAAPAPPRSWREILHAVSTWNDVYAAGVETGELGRVPRQKLPLAVQRWLAAYRLSLWLGNCWTTVLAQHVDDLVQGVEGFEECGFQPGAQGGREVIAAIKARGLDPAAADFENQSWRLTEDERESLEDEVGKIDERYIEQTWAADEELNAKLLAWAKELATSD